MTKDQLISKLKEIIQGGSQRSCAQQLGISEAYLSDILSGKRDPGPKLLEPIGLIRVVSYENPTKEESQ